MEDLPDEYRRQVRKQLRREIHPGSISVDLPTKWLSRNAVDKLHWSARGRLRAFYVALLGELGLCFPKGLRGGRWSLGLTRVLGPKERLYDTDNLVGGAKQLIDAMVSCGWFVDDSPKFLVVNCFQDEDFRGVGPFIRAKLVQIPDE